MKSIQLLMVTSDNNNKFYNMLENSDGTFTAKWGRVGTSENITIYPIDKWNSQYRSKIKKGYKDITQFKVDIQKSSFKDISDISIHNLLNTLQKYAKQSIIDNYICSSEQVTELQVNEAQNILNDIVKYCNKKNFSTSIIDSKLTELYHIIPRKMNNVKNFILNGDGDLTKAKEIIKREQNAIDVMRQQVSMNLSNNDESKTLEDVLGIKVEKCNDEDIDIIKKMMSKNVNQFKNAYKVINIETQKNFETQKKQSFKHWTKLLWHGSRNENWLNILKTGLKIKPTNVVTTGSMYGVGIYYADKCQKSIGYTSLKNSYWTNGNASHAFLAIYEVNTGMEYRVDRHNSEFYDYNERKLKSKGDYDSLFAKSGIDLVNNEYIIYKESQCTIKYLVEIGE